MKSQEQIQISEKKWLIAKTLIMHFAAKWLMKRLLINDDKKIISIIP